jgi:hypothetical protein
VYERETSGFAAIPGGPFVFDMPMALFALYARAPVIQDCFEGRQGLATANNARFVRLWWEVSSKDIAFHCANKDVALASRKRWFPYNKGGAPTAWWGNQEHVVNWQHDGKEIREFGTESGGRPRSAVRNENFYFRTAVTWSNIGAASAQFRHIPEGFLFDVAGMSLFSDSYEKHLAVLGYLNSSAAKAGLDVLAPTLNYQVGDVGRLPFVDGSDDNERVQRLIELSRNAWSEGETSHEFRGSPLVATGEPRVETALKLLRDARTKRHEEITNLEETSNEYWSSRIEEVSGEALDESLAYLRRPYEEASDEEEIEQLVSYAVGCMFGRYDLDEPGLALANHGQSLEGLKARLPESRLEQDKDNVIPIVDGPWFEDDIVAKFRQFLRLAFGETHFQENLQFVTQALGVNDLRTYFRKSFFKSHVQRYRKRPIYWLFSSAEGSFSALMYLHRYNSSTVSAVLNDYLREFIRKLEVELEKQERIAAGGATAKEISSGQKEADRLRKVLIELADYERELYALASQQIVLDLDDGVMANYQRFGNAVPDIGLKKGAGDE